MKALLGEWSPLSLALSCVLAGIALCLRADNHLLAAFETHGVAWLFAVSFMVGVAVLCAVVLVSAHDNERRRTSIGLGLTAGAAGTLFAALLDAVPAFLSAAGSGGLLGFGLTCLLRQWGRYYRSFSFKGALLNTALAFLGASVLWFAMMFAGTPFIFCLGMLALVLCGSLPLLASDIVRADEIRAGFRNDETARWTPLVTIWQVMRSGWAAVAGLMFNFFTIGLTFWPLAAGLDGGNVSLKPLSYLVIVVVVGLVVLRTREVQGGVLEVFYRTTLPIAAAIMLASPFLDPVVPPAADLAFSTFSYLGIAACNVLGLVILFWSAKSSDVGFSKMFAAFCASCAASMGAGMVVFQLLGRDAQVVSLCLLAAYLAAMVLGEVRIFRKRIREKAEAPAGEELFDTVEGSD